MNTINLNTIFPIRHKKFQKNEIFDIAIIGAGVVGCAIFKEFCEQGAKAVLIEKENDILEGASKGNSALLHTGFDAPAESLELACVQKGYDEFLKLKDELNLQILHTKAMVVAWNEEQLEKLDGILKKGLGNGVQELEQIASSKVLSMEPNLSKNAQGAIIVHGEAVIDAWSAPLAYVKKGISCGGKTAFSHEVTNGKHNGAYWELDTKQNPIRAKVVINAAGLYGDIVEKISGNIDFKIIPRKGQFLIFDETAYDLINSIILPVPTKRTKGVVITKTAFGNLLVGPTAEDQDNRIDSITTKETLEDLKQKAYTMLPALEEHEVTAIFAGLRPASDETYYRVKFNDEKNWITVGGIRSTGLTSALGLAKHVYELNDTKYNSPKASKKISIPNISQFSSRDHQVAGYGRIVCHCEMVTDREIREACVGDTPAGTMSGLKRRTRAMMGRCQGFNCMASVASICESEVKKSCTKMI
ncbi:MAG: NAD(P)/FAD-dependent oxidoreductase [Sulfurovum sp.]|nr:NAD(P)/FAD-dependent oxidoreductase [Sulfurovum sp.]